MATQDPALYPFNSLTLQTDEIQTHVQKYILHRKIGRHATRTDQLGPFAFGFQPILREQIQSTAFM
jgi:hypothetical protein